MRNIALFLSVKPIFANKILSGMKTIELRRVRPSISQGDGVLIYSSSPEMRLIGSAKVARIISGPPCELWPQVKKHAGVTSDEYDDYFEGATTATGIQLCEVMRLAIPIPLQEIRQRWPWLRPPQSYRYVDASFDPRGRSVRSLAPCG